MPPQAIWRTRIVNSAMQFLSPYVDEDAFRRNQYGRQKIGYPALRVTVLSRAGEKLRSIEIASSDYVHGRVVGSELVEIHVPISPDAASFEITAFYKE